MNITNRDITFVIRMRNEARSAMQALGGDFRGLGAAAAAARTSSNAFFADTVSGRAKLMALNDALRQAHTGALNMGRGFTQAGAAMKGMHGSAASVARETRALLDEISSGRYRQAMGSMLLLATRGFGIGLPAVGAGLALGAIPVGAAVQGFRLNAAQAAYSRGSQLYGNAYGLSQGDAMGMANRLGMSSGISNATALGVLTAALGGNATGGMDHTTLAKILGMSKDYATAIGGTQDAAANKLAGMTKDPYASAQELDKAYNLFSADQLEQIKHLEDLGYVTKAANLMLDGFNQRIKGSSENISALGKIWEGFSGGLSRWLEHIAAAAAPSLGTPAEQLAHWRGMRPDPSSSPEEQAAQQRDIDQHIASFGDHGSLPGDEWGPESARRRTNSHDMATGEDAMRPWLAQKAAYQDQAKKWAISDPDLSSYYTSIANGAKSPAEQYQAQAKDILASLDVPWYDRGKKLSLATYRRGARGSASDMAAEAAAHGSAIDAQQLLAVRNQIDKTNDLSGATMNSSIAIAGGGAAAAAAEALLKAWGDENASAAGKVNELTQALLRQQAAAGVAASANGVASSAYALSQAAGISAVAGNVVAFPGGKADIAKARRDASITAKYKTAFDAAQASGDKNAVSRIMANIASEQANAASEANQNSTTDFYSWMSDQQANAAKVTADYNALPAAAGVRHPLLTREQVGVQAQAVNSGQLGGNATPDQLQSIQAAIAHTDKLKTSLEEATDAQKQFDSYSNEFGHAFSTSIVDMVNHTTTLRSALANIVKLLENDFANSLIAKPMSDAISSFLSPNSSMGQSVGGGAGTGGAGAGILGGIASIFSGSLFSSVGKGAMSLLSDIFHTGGVVGDSIVASRAVSAALFANAPRYHTGGIAGDEVPAVLKRGEEVLTATDPRHRNNGGNSGPNTHFSPNVTINIGGGGSSPSANKSLSTMLASQVSHAIDQKMADFLQKQQRTGGMLNRTIAA